MAHDWHDGSANPYQFPREKARGLRPKHEKLRSSVESDKAEVKAEWWARWDGGSRSGTRLVSARRSFAQIKAVELRIGDPLHICLCAPPPLAHEQVKTPKSVV